MRFSLASTLVVALATDVALASTWLSKTGGCSPSEGGSLSICCSLVTLVWVPVQTTDSSAVYNKWHETELERWLSDHNVPYPTPADRKDLENLVKDNWNAYAVQPYNSWDAAQLQKWLSSQGYEVKKGAEKNKDGLASQVQGYWTETADSADKAYTDVKDWIFDTYALPFPTLPPSLQLNANLYYAAGQNPNSKHSSTAMASPIPNPPPKTTCSPPPAQTTNPSPPSLAKRPSTPATGYTRTGPTPTSKRGATSVGSPFLNHPRATS